MRVIFVYFGPFDVNSAIQAFHFGNELTELGWSVTVAGLGDPGRVEAVGKPRFECVEHGELEAKVEAQPRAGDGTIICAWTPRERVRRLAVRLAGRLGAPYVIHLEDNEEYLLEEATGRPLAAWRRLPVADQNKVGSDLIHPTRHLEFLREASGVTMITEELNEFNVAERPHHVARPGIDTARFRPDLTPPVSRERLGLAPEDFVVVYHGTIHYANQHEMLSLYLAVKLLQRRGRRVRLVRLGHSGFGGVDPGSFGALADGTLELGAVPWREVPNYLALADAYVQPGRADAFNRYRLPSKLPEFLAMGRPVILPHCNIGKDLTHGENALLLEDGNAEEIAARIDELIDAPALAERLGRAAREFALERLCWRVNSAGLAEFLRGVIATPAASGAG